MIDLLITTSIILLIANTLLFLSVRTSPIYDVVHIHKTQPEERQPKREEKEEEEQKEKVYLTLRSENNILRFKDKKELYKTFTNFESIEPFAKGSDLQKECYYINLYYPEYVIKEFNYTS